MAINLLTTVLALSGGVAPVAGVGEDTQLTVAGTWAVNDDFTLTMTDSITGLQTQIGAGNVSGIPFSYVFTLNQKVYGISGATFYYSAVGNPLTWNDPNAAGNGFDTTSNYYATAEPLVALAPFQGQMLAISRRTLQLWAVDPDPANYDMVQVLANIGTVAAATVQPVGDMDVYMLADNGIRSARVRVASNNALIADVGTPIDNILVPLLATLTDAQKATACGIVEPSSNRYWCYVPTPSGAAGSIYVFSYFPSSEIAAWGTYAPSYQVAVAAPGANYAAGVLTYTGLTIGARYAWLPGADEISLTNGATLLKSEGAFVATATTAVIVGTGLTAAFTGALSVTTPFVPTKFLIYKGQIWARAGNVFLQLGGSTNLVYDNCGVTAVTPFIDSSAPGTRKNFESVDASFAGTWQISGSADFTVQKYRLLYNATASSWMRTAVGWGTMGTHYSLQFVESGSAYALFSAAAVHEQKGNDK